MLRGSVSSEAPFSGVSTATSQCPRWASVCEQGAGRLASLPRSSRKSPVLSDEGQPVTSSLLPYLLCRCSPLGVRASTQTVGRPPIARGKGCPPSGGKISPPAARGPSARLGDDRPSGCDSSGMAGGDPPSREPLATVRTVAGRGARTLGCLLKTRLLRRLLYQRPARCHTRGEALRSVLWDK